MAKKPWRTVQFSEDTGRFTRQQIEDAVRVVKERNEARKKNGSHPRTARTAGAARMDEASAGNSGSEAAAHARSKREG
jgi:hypothetical protein